MGLWQKRLLVLAQTLIGLPLLSWLYLRISFASVRISRRCPQRAFAYSPAKIALTLACSTWLPLRWLHVNDYFPPDICSPKQFFLPYCRGNIALDYSGNCSHRGNFASGATTITLPDPLGLWLARRTLVHPDSILVLPQIEQLPWHSLRSNQSPYWIGSGNRVGASNEFLGTREYRPGDSLRYLHWPASAHTGKLIVKEFHNYAIARITVAIDLDKRVLQGIKPTTVDYAVKIAGSLAKYACDQMKEFRIMARGRQSYLFPFGRGAAHLAWILGEMALMRPNGEQPLPELLSECLARIDAGEHLVVICCTHTMVIEQYINLFTVLQARGVAITVVLLLSASFESLWHYHHESNFLGQSQMAGNWLPAVFR